MTASDLTGNRCCSCTSLKMLLILWLKRRLCLLAEQWGSTKSWESRRSLSSERGDERRSLGTVMGFTLRDGLRNVAAIAAPALLPRLYPPWITGSKKVVCSAFFLMDRGLQTTPERDGRNYQWKINSSGFPFLFAALRLHMPLAQVRPCQPVGPSW